VLAIAKRRGWSAFYAPSMRNGARTPEDRGNAILSTLPLSDLTVLELPFEHQRRTVVAASVPAIVVDGKPLRVISVHLDTQSGWRRGRLLWFGRERQAAALVSYLRTPDSTGRHVPLVVGGDFNTWLGELEPAYRITARNFPDSPRASNHVTFPLLGAAGVHLDHMFFNLPSGLTPKVVRLDEKHGSDHFPLLATFENKVI
jgi:endonuclease/exonuclease/phosphatase family metal-dependent hydrolase